LFGQPFRLYSLPPELNRINQSQGIKYFKNYLPREHEFHPQNWWILQDKQGIIYVANQGGLLEFDGVNWKTISIPNISVRSIARAEDTGRIYIGGNNEIGCLIPDSTGSIQYVSLLQHLEDDKKNFANVWQTVWTKEGVYFRTSKFLFRWNSRDMKIWQAKTIFRALFYCKGKLFILQHEPGLMQILKDKLVLVPGGKTFSHKKICMMAPYPDETSDAGKILIATRAAGCYLYDGITASGFSTEIDSYLEKAKISHGIALSSSPGSFALATRQGGLIIINSQGRLEQIYDKRYGLQDQDVKYVFEDSAGNIWLGLGKGISKIEHHSPISINDDRANLSGLVLSVARHGPQKDLYIGTTTGLYILSSTTLSAPNGHGKFYPVPGIQGSCWSLLSIGDSLLVASTLGVFQVKNTSKEIIENPSYILQPSQQGPQRVWVGTANGIISLHREKGQWVKEQNLQPVTEEVRSIVENKKGELWLGTLSHGVLKVNLSMDKALTNPAVTVKRFDTSQGLPIGEVHVFMAADHVMTATVKGIYRFDEKNNFFVPDFTLGKEFAGGAQGVFRIAEDRNKHIWFHSSNRNYEAIPQPDGSFIINKKPFLRIPLAQVNAIYPEPGGTATWFAGNNGLVRYDTTVKKNYHHDFPTLIRKVWVNGNLVFNGCKYKTGNDPRGLFSIIDYKDRNLRFEFAAPFFEDESATRYQCLLEGYDGDWTAWNKETKKDYTNLDAGFYTFRVRAKNVYEVLSREDVFQFKILPPWYKTWWAFSIYVLGFLLLMFFAVKWRSKYLENEKQELEKIVKYRTKEIEEQKCQLEKQTIQLAEQSEKLKEMDEVKSRFFANISHEFRTPITLIMGPLEQMLSACPGHDRAQKKKLRMMLRNCQRLLRLINQLLELANFESGTMKLQSRPRNIIHFLKGIIASFEILTDQEELDLTFYAEEEDINLYLDERKMEDVICNLLTNAIKFTPAGGKITVTCTKGLTEKVNFPSGSVKISVSDTGPGIPGDKLADIFDRFYQSESTYEHYHQGFGIGLAIARELVELHHGTIDVHSTEGQGTEFIMELPLGDQHLKPEEIINLTGESVSPPEPGEISTPDMVKAEKEEEEPGEEMEQEITAEKAAKDIILVVEDSVDMRNYIKGSLEPQYQVVEAIDGRDGIEKASQIIPDLIISDIMMPETDGYELCRVLKNNRDTSHIPIILLTAKASEENILQGLELGADDYVTKPFSTQLLCARITNLIELRRHLQLNMEREMTLKPDKTSVSNIDKEFVKDLQEVINKNISDPEFNVEELCKRLYMGRTTLYRKILALTGEPPTEYIRSYRLKRGAELLKSGRGSVLEVAFEVGFSSANYFSKCFKKKFHQLPSSFQASEAKREL
jgi:signal transduction histidine kinase/DNA-binding response OmpR family regulator